MVACEDIKVKFVNVHVLESARYKTKDILSCANRWSVPGSTIFRFVAVTDDNPADIVVKLNQEGIFLCTMCVITIINFYSTAAVPLML